MRRIALLLACTLAALAPSVTRAQDRALTWPSVAVTAHLDADGKLHVRERQAMRFTGDWNGGERRFDVRFGQRFTFERLARLDTVSGVERPLTEGSLEEVDGYELMSGNVLRWRSRMPEDPPFDSTTLVYVLAFTYDRILDANEDGSFTLAHDFAFADRSGEFTRYTVDLTLDSAWRAPAGFTGHYEAAPLPPYEGYVIRVPLTYAGATPPGGVRSGAPISVRYALLVLLGVGGIAMLVRTVRHAQQRGQLVPLVSRDEVTTAFLDEHVFAQRAEVVGAAWDGETSEAEVAATLARLVQEKKLASRVETAKVLVFTRHVLHLELKVKRDAFTGYEAALVEALFWPGTTVTDTDKVRKRYSSSGFNPASVIRSGVETKAERIAMDADADTEKALARTRRLVTFALAAVAVVLLVIAFTQGLADGTVALLAMGVLIPGALLGTLMGHVMRNRVSGYGMALATVAFFTLAMTGVVGWLLVDNRWRAGAAALAAVVVWALAMLNAISASACTVQSRDRIALRKRLAAARAWFEAELRTREPRLVDAWYPYLLAFGLGRHVDRWFKSFGGETARTMSRTRMNTSSIGASHASSASSSASPPFTGFGGGGGFSGSGGGVSFGAALGSMASTVSSPSSSSSGGSSSSSSSSSSSGGGGGGGW